MSPPSPANSTSQVNNQWSIDHAPAIPAIYVVSVPRIARWQICYRLQELMIPCSCPPDGSLHVEVQSSTGALLLRSVVQQFVASRPEMVNWLERCWHFD